MDYVNTGWKSIQIRNYTKDTYQPLDQGIPRKSIQEIQRKLLMV